MPTECCVHVQVAADQDPPWVPMDAMKDLFGPLVQSGACLVEACAIIVEK